MAEQANVQHLSSAGSAGSAGSGGRAEGGGLKAAELAERLRRMILSQGLQPGAGLPSEADLIDKYGLSRATVREAIRILDAEGFIEVRRGRYGGVHVKHPSVDQFSSWLSAQLTLRGTPARALVEMRRVIEPAAAELAAERATPEHLERLRALTESLDPAVEIEFHKVIAEASGNDLVELVLRAVHSGLCMLPPYGSGLTGSDLEMGTVAHKRILRAIEERDGDWAAAAMRKHLYAIEEVVERNYHLDEPLLPPSHWA